MVSLLDIAPARETVEIGGTPVELRAISADQIVTLMQRFGGIFELLGGDMSQIGAAVKPAIGALIAAATGNLGDAAQEAHAAEFSIGDQVAVLAAIRRLTMPKGVRPFVEDLQALGLPLDGLLEALDKSTSVLNLPAAPTN